MCDPVRVCASECVSTCVCTSLNHLSLEFGHKIPQRGCVSFLARQAWPEVASFDFPGEGTGPILIPWPSLLALERFLRTALKEHRAAPSDRDTEVWLQAQRHFPLQEKSLSSLSYLDRVCTQRPVLLGLLRSGGGALMPFLAPLAPESYLSKHLGMGGAEGAECLRVWGLESHGPGLRTSLCLFCGLANYLLKLP